MAAKAVSFSESVDQIQTLQSYNWQADLDSVICRSKELAANCFSTGAMNKELYQRDLNEAITIWNKCPDVLIREKISSVIKGLWTLECSIKLNNLSQTRSIIIELIDGSPLVVIQTLGQGSFGKVVEVECHKIRIAEKILAPSIGALEFEAHLKARGDGVINILYGFKTLDHRYVIGLELANKTFEDEFLNGPFYPLMPNELIMKFTKGLIQKSLEALSALHSRNIVHRDIKADNILLVPDREDDRVKLGDLETSISVDSKDSKKSRNQHGNIYHTALEVLSDGVPKTTSSDMWSFGITLFRILTKQFPYGNELIHIAMEYKLTSLSDYLYKRESINESVLNYLNEKELSLLDLCPQDKEPSQALETLCKTLGLIGTEKQELCDLIYDISFNQDAIRMAKIKYPLAYSLIKELLKIAPNKRLSAKDALAHPWFTAPNLEEPHVHV